MLLLSARSGKAAQRYGPKWFLVLGPMVIAAALLLYTQVKPGASYLLLVLPATALFGLGLVLVVAPVTATVLASAADRHAGVASGVNNAIARTGGLLAVAVLPAAAGLSGSAYADPVALTDGWQMAMWLCAALCVVGGVMALGVRNDVLSAAPAQPATPVRPAEPQVAAVAPVGARSAADDSPHPGECFSCGIVGPPTHITPVREVAATARKPDEAA